MILHVITGLSTGGAERALFNVLSGGLANRFHSSVVSLRDEGRIGPRIRELGIPVHSLGMRAGMPTPGAIARLRRVISATGPDMIQGWMYHGNLGASLAACLAPGSPAIAWNVRHSLYELQAEKFLTRQVIRANRLLSRRVDSIIYNSRLSRGQHELFGFDDAPGVVIPNGFDLARLAANPEASTAVRAELGIPSDSLVVGHVARFNPMKDHASFLRAAVRVSQTNPTARFLLVGREVSPENPELAGIVPPGLLERFAFAGERRDVDRLMQAMDVFCLSSWSEAFPNVLGEAMACGVPCVATDVGDSRDIVGDSGLMVPPRDSEALADALVSLLAKEPAERLALGQAARRSIEQRYALPRMVERYAELYRGIGQ
ncbi:glycosyltransferase [Spiribacter sp. 1M153]|uniref:glycosyltransferase family 4 protein n=1 Tax=Spiribacter roseus TaxID=1855875 RepID=UPI00349FAD9A